MDSGTFRKYTADKFHYSNDIVEKAFYLMIFIENKYRLIKQYYQPTPSSQTYLISVKVKGLRSLDIYHDNALLDMYKLRCNVIHQGNANNIVYSLPKTTNCDANVVSAIASAVGI